MLPLPLEMILNWKHSLACICFHRVNKQANRLRGWSILTNILKRLNTACFSSQVLQLLKYKICWGLTRFSQLFYVNEEKSTTLAKLGFSFNPVGIKYNAVVLLTFNVGFKLRGMKVAQQPTFIFVLYPFYSTLLNKTACFSPHVFMLFTW